MAIRDMSNSAPEVYSHRANPAFEAELAARTASKEAAFLIPYLRPGMQVLDVGCGPGSDHRWASPRSSHPAQVVGIDVQSAQIEQARALAATRGLASVRFEIADIYSLPFPDGSFDAAFANGVLMHLREPVRALAELRRVLRPGGIVGYATRIGELSTRPRRRCWSSGFALRVRVRQHNGGDPFLSRHYRRLLLEAGFARAEASACVDSAGSPEETRRHAAFLKATFQGFARTAVAEGWMDQAAMDATAAEIDAWARRPDAFAATTWCQALGWAERLKAIRARACSRQIPLNPTPFFVLGGAGGCTGIHGDSGAGCTATKLTD